MAPGSLGVVLDRSPPACPAGLAPGPLAFRPGAAAGALPGATTALATVAPGPLLVGERLAGVGAFWAAWTSRGLAGRCRRHGCPSWRGRRELAKTWGAGGPAWAPL